MPPSNTIRYGYPTPAFEFDQVTPPSALLNTSPVLRPAQTTLGCVGSTARDTTVRNDGAPVMTLTVHVAPPSMLFITWLAEVPR